MMNRFWIRLILIQCLAFICSLSFAANEYGQPTIFSGSGVAYGRCEIIRIHSLTELGGQVYTQSGVGWYILGEEGYRILTPAHVISGADIILGECLGRHFPIQLQSRTETLDLALLRPLSDVTSIASPLIYLKNRSQTIAEANSTRKAVIESMHPDHFAGDLETKIKAQVANSYQIPGVSAEHPILEVKTFDGDMGKVGIAHFQKGLDSVVAETLGITPGYSGAPLFAHLAKENFNDADFFIHTMTGGDYNSMYLMGMLTKTEINGSRSLGISLQMILKTLPLLMSTQNTEVDVHTSSARSAWSLRYKNELINRTLERSRELIYNSPGASRKSFSEVCEDDTLESSEWTPTPKSQVSLKEKLKEFKKLQLDKKNIEQMNSVIKAFKLDSQKLRSIQQKSGGGDYGEGGGSAISLKHSHLMVVDRTQINNRGYNLASYRRDKPCEKVTIIDNLGNRFDTIHLQGRIEKATSLTEAYNYLSAGGQWTSAANASLCKSYKLVDSMIGGLIPTYYEANGKSYLHVRGDGIAALPEKLRGNSALGSLYCNGNRIDLQLEQEGLKVKAHLGDAQNPSGFIQLNNTSCLVSLSPKNYFISNPWKHQIRSPLLDVDISLGTEGRILSIKILKAAPKCAEDSRVNLWLFETHFYEQQAMNAKYIQWKAQVQQKKDQQ